MRVFYDIALDGEIGFIPVSRSGCGDVKNLHHCSLLVARFIVTDKFEFVLYVFVISILEAFFRVL